MVFRHFTVSTAICAALLAGAAGPSFAGMESGWSAPSGTAVRLLAGAKQDGALTGGIEIRLVTGWKTYWRYPGDSGIPPRFDWSASENVEAVEVAWPAPQRFDDGDGNFSIGYKHDVVLPFRAAPKDPGQPVKLRLALDFAVCEKICQPAHATLALDVPAGGAAPSQQALTAALAAVPEKAAGGPLRIETAALADQPGGKTVRIEARVSGSSKLDLFVEGPNEDWALPLPTLKGVKDGRATFLMPVDGVPRGADIAGTPLRFTLVEGDRAVEVEAQLSAP